MKKILALTLAVVFALMLLASCGNNTNPPAVTDDPSAAVPNTPVVPEGTDPAQEPESDLPFAVDERGIATEPYNYPLPLTEDEDLVLTCWWSTYFGQYLPPDKDYQDTDLPAEAKARTGVNVEYMVIPPANRQENFSVLLASDDVCDITCGAQTYYPGNPVQMVEDGYFVNIYDYREYMPNYLYQAAYANPDDHNTYESVFYTDEFIPTVFVLLSTDVVTDTGFCVRQDWLDKFDMSAEDLVTWDDLYDAFMLMKTNIDTCEFPFWLSMMIETNNYWQFNSFNNLSVVTTVGLPPMYLIDGKVNMGCTTEGDKQLMEKFNEFYNAGLINPDWQAYFYAGMFTDHTYNNEVFYQSLGATSINTAINLTNDPNCKWAPVQKPLVTEDQILHAGTVRSRTSTGNCAFAAKNTNLEIAMKWIDYRYSPDGWELYCYGPEGKVCEIGEDGVRRNTEWALNNPDGMELSALVSVYTLGQLIEPGMYSYDNQLLNPAGQIAIDAVESWTTWLNAHSDNSGALPIGVRLDTEQSNAVAEYRTDIITYVAEGFAGFLDGSNPLSNWDSYLETLDQMGLQNIIDIYQEAYDNYLANKAA